MIWKPHVTVAAIIEQQQKFLVVEETTANGIEFNQPAGHLDEHEDLISAVKREVLEETAWQFTPEALLGIYMWRKSPEHPTYLRICFTGSCHAHNANQALDEGIIAAHWLTRDEVAGKPLRSPLVINCIDDYLRGQRYPLALIHTLLADQYA